MKHVISMILRSIRGGFIALAVFQFTLGGPLTATAQAHEPGRTRSPIKHVIVLIGENRTFDHLFATYVPKSRDSVKNLLSEGIINADGSPGPHFRRSPVPGCRPVQDRILRKSGGNGEGPLPEAAGADFELFPEPGHGRAASVSGVDAACPAGRGRTLPRNGGPAFADDGRGWGGPDRRAAGCRHADQNFSNLPNGPFPLEGANLPYDSYTGDTTHRLYEMWQQSDCNIGNATRQNPSGCLNDLYPFVITNYTSELDPNSFPLPNQVDDNGGGNSMAFYNMQKGDVPS